MSSSLSGSVILDGIKSRTRFMRARDAAGSGGSGDSPTSQAGGLAIELKGISKTYATRKGPVEAVRSTSLEIADGEFVSLVGPSGCGKSTVLKMVAGLIDSDGGEVKVRGVAARAGRKDTGIMLQSPVLLPWRTVMDNVLLPIEVFGDSRKEAKERASSLISLVGLEGFESAYPWELSGGMQQRASLARLLVFEPAILLMDEPFAALDEFTREQLLKELVQIHEEMKRSALYVTHNISEAVLLSDRVVVMRAHPGEVAAIIDVDLPRPRQVSQLSEPETVALMDKIRDLLNIGEGENE